MLRVILFMHVRGVTDDMALVGNTACNNDISLESE